MPTARDCRQFHTVARRGRPRSPHSPGRRLQQRCPSWPRMSSASPLLLTRYTRETAPARRWPYSDAVSVVPPLIPSPFSSDRVRGGRLLARPSISAVPGTALVAAFAVHNALKKHRHRHRPPTFSGKHRPTPTDLEKSDTVTTLHLRLIGKRVVDFLLALIELFLLGVTSEALRAIIGSKSAILLQRSG